MIKITTVYRAHIIGEHIYAHNIHMIHYWTSLSEYLHPMRDHLFTKHIEIVAALDDSDNNMKDSVVDSFVSISNLFSMLLTEYTRF